MGPCISRPMSAATSPAIPQSLLKPQAALQPPGQCVFGEDFRPAKLVSKMAVGKNTQVFTFELPDTTKSLGLSTCACILARGGKDDQGNPVVRPYTPISTNNLIGKFELMVKIYPDGKLSQHMCNMPIGDTIDFKHINFNVKIQYPFNKKKIGMICGGTG
jgi:cytochrome-b5 reductase